MKGWRFYQEFTDTTRRVPDGNVVAICTDIDPYISDHVAMREGLSATFFHANSDVSWGGVALEYLSTRCKRISEAKARQIHPKLFERLDI